MPKSIDDLYEESLPDSLPINVIPASNEEFVPPPPTREQIAIQKIAMEEIDRQARRHGTTRRRFLQKSAAYAITMTAINQVMGRNGGYYAHAYDGTCNPVLHNGLGAEFPIDHPNAQFSALPGEFIMDVQTHHVDSGGTWRARNPGEATFFGVVWSQASCGEQDRIECLGRFHYMKELFLDSATDVCILSAVPYNDDGQPLPIEEAAKTCQLVEELSGRTKRAYMHRFVFPNRGSLGSTSDGTFDPVFWPEERDLMTEAAIQHGPGGTGYLKAWKVYCPWGDVPYTTGWWLDGAMGQQFIAHAEQLAAQYGVPALIAAHKGFALTAFDQSKAATRDVGVVAKQFPNMNFMIYHSGFDNSDLLAFPPGGIGTSTNGPYPLDIATGGAFRLGMGNDTAVSSTLRGVDNFIKALRENGWSARNFAPGGRPGVRGKTHPLDPINGDGDPGAHSNVPNVYAELGSVWSSVQSNPTTASYLLGKLIYYVGARQIVWGTDSLWYGSPQGLIETFRAFEMSNAIKQLYNLPWGLHGDVDDPTRDTRVASNYGGRPAPERSIRTGILGRNAARVYQIDPDRTLGLIRCDDVQKIRDEYMVNRLADATPRGPTTRRELFAAVRRDPWFRGATKELNASGKRRPV
jgi:hypothetical protein